MAYSNSWDENDPDGNVVSASQIDEEINQVKQDVRERIEQVIPDWGDDTVDPKVLGEGEGRILVDTETNRPSSPDFDGQVFYATDTDNLYVGVGGNWTQFTPGGGGGGSGGGVGQISGGPLEFMVAGTGSQDDRMFMFSEIVLPGSESKVAFGVPFDVIINQLEVRVSVEPGTGESLEFVLRKNFGDTALSVKMTDSQFSAFNKAEAINVAEGIPINMKVIRSAGAAQTAIQFMLGYEVA